MAGRDRTSQAGKVPANAETWAAVVGTQLISAKLEGRTGRSRGLLAGLNENEQIPNRAPGQILSASGAASLCMLMKLIRLPLKVRHTLYKNNTCIRQGLSQDTIYHRPEDI